jgi:hypothetical protein
MPRQSLINTSTTRAWLWIEEGADLWARASCTKGLSDQLVVSKRITTTQVAYMYHFPPAKREATARP